MNMHEPAWIQFILKMAKLLQFTNIQTWSVKSNSNEAYTSLIVRLSLFRWCIIGGLLLWNPSAPTFNKQSLTEFDIKLISGYILDRHSSLDWMQIHLTTTQDYRKQEIFFTQTGVFSRVWLQP